MANEPNKLPDDESASNDAPVTREEFTALSTQLQKQSRYLAKLEKLLSGKQSETVSQNAEGSEPQGLREKVEQLAKQQAEITAQSERLQRGKVAAAAIPADRQRLRPCAHAGLPHMAGRAAAHRPLGVLTHVGHRRCPACKVKRQVRSERNRGSVFRP